MSFILDALRKSEHARGSQALPGLVGLPVSRPATSRLPLWLGGIGVLLVINVVVLAVVLLRPAPPAAAPAPAAPPVASALSAARPAPAQVAAAAAATAAAVAERTRPLEEEAGDAPADAADAAPEPDIRPAARAASERAALPAATVPTLNDLPAESTTGLPRLNIDLHVWSGDPQTRFAVINGQRVHEGSQLHEGLTVERITQDGVVLNYHGNHFLLPRQ